jgi:AraC-like DNA-binding protein
MCTDTLGLTMRGHSSSEAPMAADTWELLTRLVDVAKSVSESDRACLRNIVEKYFPMLPGSPRYSDAIGARSLGGGLASWQAKRVAAYVSENIGRSFRVRDLAALVQLSYGQFNRAFKVSFRETPTAYIIRQRIGVAQAQMLTTGHALSQVALECGMSDQAHFSRTFRRIVGQSPRLWRRQLASGFPALALNENDIARSR